MTASELQRIIDSAGLTRKEWYCQIYLKSDHWKALKKAKFGESGRKCEICGTLKKVQVHHVNYRNIFDVALSDLQVLCDGHHRDIHGIARKKIAGQPGIPGAKAKKRVAAAYRKLSKAQKSGNATKIRNAWSTVRLYENKLARIIK